MCMAGELGNNSRTLTPDGKQPTQPAGGCVKRTGPESPRQGLTASLWPCDLGQVTSYLWLPQSCLQSETPHPRPLRGQPALSIRVCVEALVHATWCCTGWYFHCALHTLGFPHSCHLSTPVSLVLLPFHVSTF